MSTLADLRRSRRTRLMLVLAYAALGVGWILVSDALVGLLPSDVRSTAGSAKGIAFVLVTGVLLWALMLVRDLRVERERTVRLAEVTARIQAVEHHRRLAGAIEATPLGVAMLTRRGVGFEIAYANRALAKLTGVPAADLVGLDPLASTGLFGPDTTTGLAARLVAGETFEDDTMLIPPDGQATPVRILVSPVAEPGDAMGSVVVIVLDRREALAREAAEARLGMVLNASPAPIVATDAEGRVTEWNPAADLAFGWRSDEVLGRSIPLLPEDARAAYGELADRVARAEGAVAVELPLLHRDGRRIHCRLQASSLAVSGGAAGGSGPGLVMTIEDLTAQIEQQHAQARLASAIDAAGEAILITNLDGAITYVNPAFERVSGYRHDELVGKNPRILQSGLTSASVYADLWRRLRSGQVWRGVLFNKRKDGSLFEEEATGGTPPAVVNPDVLPMPPDPPSGPDASASASATASAEASPSSSESASPSGPASAPPSGTPPPYNGPVWSGDVAVLSPDIQAILAAAQTGTHVAPVFDICVITPKPPGCPTGLSAIVNLRATLPVVATLGPTISVLFVDSPTSNMAIVGYAVDPSTTSDVRFWAASGTPAVVQSASAMATAQIDGKTVILARLDVAAATDYRFQVVAGSGIAAAVSPLGSFRTGAGVTQFDVSVGSAPTPSLGLGSGLSPYLHVPQALGVFVPPMIPASSAGASCVSEGRFNGQAFCLEAQPALTLAACPKATVTYALSGVDAAGVVVRAYPLGGSGGVGGIVEANGATPSGSVDVGCLTSGITYTIALYAQGDGSGVLAQRTVAVP